MINLFEREGFSQIVYQLVRKAGTAELRACYFVWMNLRESKKMNLCVFE